MRLLIPAFITSELKTAFQIGFIIFIPFLVVDMVVASVLMSMGMMMMSPVMVALALETDAVRPRRWLASAARLAGRELRHVTPELVMDIGRQAVEMTLLMSAPLLLAALVIGLIISIFQAATQINEQTLSFIPKLVGMFLILLLAGPWMLRDHGRLRAAAVREHPAPDRLNAQIMISLRRFVSRYRLSHQSAWVVAFFFPLARILAVFAAAPPFDHPALSTRVRLLLGLAISMAIVPVLPSMPPLDPASGSGLLILAQQLLVGFRHGFCHPPGLSAVDMAGNLISLQMGLGFATSYDPQTAGQTAVISEFMGLLALLVFLAINGHLMVIATLAHSFTALPVSTGRACTADSWGRLANAWARSSFPRGCSWRCPSSSP
jgi:flagellar biosynthetic protein FliQ